MKKAEIINKIQSCKALQGKTIADIIKLPEFVDNLAAYLRAQREDREAVRRSYLAMRKAGGARGMKLPAHAIDRVADLGAQEFAGEYLAVLQKTCKRSAAEREYIAQLGTQAYNVTIANFVVAEFPELREFFFPKANNN